MDPTALINSIGQLGMGGVVFIIWYFDQKKVDSLKDIVQEQVEEKRLMRDDRNQLLSLIERQATLISRAVTLLDRMEQRQGRVIEKVV